MIHKNKTVHLFRVFTPKVFKKNNCVMLHKKTWYYIFTNTHMLLYLLYQDINEYITVLTNTMVYEL